MLRHSLSFVRSVLITIPLVIGISVVMMVGALTLRIFIRQPDFDERAMRRWARLLLWAGGVTCVPAGIEKIERSRSYVLCVNHLSFVDPPLVLACLPNRGHFLAKASLFRIPVLGWALRGFGHFPIVRDNPRAAARVLARASDELPSGSSLIVFPEGGRSFDGELQPFKSGAFRIAIALQAPIVPVVIIGTRQILAPGSLVIRGGAVELIAGDPIPTAGMEAKDRTTLGERVRKVMEEMLARACEEGPKEPLNF